MITGSEMAVVDENAAALGVSRKQLMESSGNAVARRVRALVEPGSEVTIVGGRGNNGGDAFVAARFLDDYDLRVLLLGRADTIGTDIARENWAALERAEYDTHEVRDSTDLALGDPDLVMDAMLGTGASGTLREPEATAATEMNASDAVVLSVDVPSGFDAETGGVEAPVEADHVVTFHDTKPGLPDLAATVTVASIGIPEAARWFVERGDLRRLSRSARSHKGDHGDILVVGGGPYTGAPALAGQAALRAGADLARVACPETVADEIQGYREDLIVESLTGGRLVPDHVDRLLDLAADRDAVVFGPGLGEAAETLAAAREFLAAATGPIVVDADALAVVPEIATDARLLCTPHQGELVGMGGETSEDWRERSELIEEFATRLGHTLLVKGHRDVISDGETTRISHTGTAGMTVGGTGDVLAGVTGAFAATQPPVAAAGLAAYVNGRAGELAGEGRDGGLLASDLLGTIPEAMTLSRGL